jgi:glycosyltransferase involved in cell wall biosynthesis
MIEIDHRARSPGGDEEMTEKRFSIIITCHNQRDFIRDAVDSALSQRHHSKEIIVIDDCSVDGSQAVLREYRGAILLEVFETNRGVNVARNRGVSRASGEYVVFLDGDDLLVPWALDVYERIIQERQPKIVFANCVTFRGQVPKFALIPDRIEFVQYPNLMSKDRPIQMVASTLVVERRALLEAGCWTPGIFEMDVQDLCTKMGYSGRLILALTPASAYYRIHATNSIHSVPPFLRNAFRLIRLVKTISRTERWKHRFQRYAHLGGILAFWVRRAFKARLYMDAVNLAVSGWLMILAAIARRSFCLIKGRQPIETLDLPRA